MTAPTELHPASLPVRPARPRAGLGRQSVVDRSGAVVGYDLRFTGSAGVADEDLTDAEAAQAELRACRMVVSAFGEMGLERFGSTRRLYVNLPRPLLTGRVPVPFGPQSVVVQVLPDVEVDDAVLAGLVALHEQGYSLAVDSGCSGDALERLYPLIDVLRVAVPQADDALADLVAYIRGIVPQARLLADSLPSAEVRELAREAGFDLLQGVEPGGAAMAGRAAPATRRGVAPSQVVCLQLLAALADPETAAEDLERIVSVDPGLSLRVLGSVNSASGAGRQVGTLRQALVLLGRRTLSTWVLLAAFGGGAGERQQLVTVLARARTCELLTPHVGGVDAATAYAAGLLTGVVDVMGVDAAQTAREAKLDAELTDALLRRQGPVGRLVSVAEDLDRDGESAEALPADEVARARVVALDDAVAAVDSVLGEG